MNIENPERLPSAHDVFKQKSIELMERRITQGAYPGYPVERLVTNSFQRSALGRICFPSGPWNTPNGDALPTSQQTNEFELLGLDIDSKGRPVHPWIDEMASKEQLGILVGKGAYWNWGPNYTADPIVVRHDLKEPHVLLIERGDGTGWALPGGFVDKGETADIAAVREANEETGVNLFKLPFTVEQVYEGALADLRITANAWPETTAFRIDLDLSDPEAQRSLVEMTAHTRLQKIVRNLGRFAFRSSINRLPWEGGDDAKRAAWVPASKCDNVLFGSHSLLVAMALE